MLAPSAGNDSCHSCLGGYMDGPLSAAASALWTVNQNGNTQSARNATSGSPLDARLAGM